MGDRTPFVVAVVGALALYGARDAVSNGRVNLGGGRTADFFGTHQDSPGLSGFGVVTLLLVAGLCGWCQWRRWRG